MDVKRAYAHVFVEKLKQSIDIGTGITTSKYTLIHTFTDYTELYFNYFDQTDTN